MKLKQIIGEKFGPKSPIRSWNSEDCFRDDFSDKKIARNKVWGEEYIIYNFRHAVKVMVLKPNTQVSLHFHSEKDETFILTEGTLVIETIGKDGETKTTILSRPYDSLTINRNTPHTFYTLDDQKEDTIFIEASTTDQPDDSYRIYPSKTRESS